MSQKNTVTEHYLAACSTHLEDVLEYIDQLHTAASEGNSQSFTGMDEVETMNVLREVIYTAQEALVEMETLRARKRQRRAKQPVLRLVKKVDKAG
jgi:hypothetical protein